MTSQRLLIRLSLCLALALGGCLSESDDADEPVGAGESGESPTDAPSNMGTSGSNPAPRATAPTESVAMAAAGAGGSAIDTSGGDGDSASGDTAPAPGTPGGLPTGTMAAPGVAATPIAPPSGPALDPSGESFADPAPVDPVGGGNGTVQSGTLTAGAWDDNQNFNRFEEYRREHADLNGALDTTDEEHTAAWELWKGERAGRDTLDVALVVDTTGSMGDEIRYLQAEFEALTNSIRDAHPDSDQRWALIMYKDEGDVFVVRSVDFTGDAAEYEGSLALMSGSGGGDYPEAPDAALEALTELDFRTDESTARLAFWVGDAPHHAQNAGRLLSAVRASSDADVHIYPVASSGVDELTELTMRTAAQLTGGRYLFLTDDSGVGGAHKEPSIPCYFVTRLDQAILRMVDIELSGTYRTPDEDHIIRTGGDPEDGACTLESGDEVLVF